VRIIHTIADLRIALAGHRDIGLVPTMGNLHDGHLSLVGAARLRSGVVVVSIFVNQLQFAPNEDFDTYPRTLERDCELLAAAGCDIVFAPSTQEIYPEPQKCTVHPPAALADVLEGAIRPGFFVGVSTVVLKLFAIVTPGIAVFGKKDYQQLLVIKNMVRQLALPIEIVPVETVREPSGIALSSRNGYLDHVQRTEAVHLNRALRKAAGEIQSGRTDWQEIERSATAALQDRGWQPDYIAVRRRSDLSAPGYAEPLVILGAARLGRTRLIDNWEID
jgi:pantoate--beta-alanine ligase